MLVNNLDIINFKAQLLKKDIQSAEVIVYDDWLRQSITPLYLGKKEKYKQIKLQLLIEDVDDETCLEDISNLVKEFTKCTIKFKNLIYYYDCTIASKSHERIVKGFYLLDVELKGFAYKAEIIETLNHVASKTINVPGNLPTPVIVEITPSIDMISIALTGLTKNPIVLKNLLANVPVTIDGEKCTVIEADIDSVITSTTGANKWNFRKYNIANFANPDDTDIHIAPTYNSIPPGASYIQKLITDGAQLVKNLGYDYIGHIKTGLNVASAKTIAFDFYHDDGCTVYLNGAIVYSHNYVVDERWAHAHVNMNLLAGWNVIEIIWIQHYGPDGIWGITPTIKSQVTSLNCFYSKNEGLGVVNKFGDTDMWAFPVLQPGANTIDLNNANCTIDIKYKSKYI